MHAFCKQTGRLYWTEWVYMLIRWSGPFTVDTFFFFLFGLIRWCVYACTCVCLCWITVKLLLRPLKIKPTLLLRAAFSTPKLFLPYSIFKPTTIKRSFCSSKMVSSLFHIQYIRFVFSKSKGLSEILQDIPDLTYQICRTEEKINLPTAFNKLICYWLMKLVIYWKYCGKRGNFHV